uniref:C2H2-type domain-containing protein n=1 Tax=Trichogramma kaykai TaxID=54128 RepID=A0ABD2XJN3_9HYME
MVCRPPQNNETEIMENYIHLDEDDTEERFLSHEELGEYKKIQEVFLTFSKTKTKDKPDLRKFLLNIAANLMRLLVLLENTPNQESTRCGGENSEANQQYTSYDNSKSLTPEDERITKKINLHVEQKNDYKDPQIPIVTIKLCANNKPACVGHTDRSLYENDKCIINEKESDSRSSQYIPPGEDNYTQALLQKNEFSNTQLNNETEIVFECKNVVPTVTSFAQQKLDYLAQNQLQDSETSETIRATIKDERLDMVKKEYLDDTTEKSNLINDCETNTQNEIIPLLNSIHDSKESEKLETCSKKLEMNSNLKVHRNAVHDHISHSCDICGKKFMQKTKLDTHTQVVHNGRKPYQCNTCGKTFALKNKLDRHINSIHIDLARHVSRKTIVQKDYYLINRIGAVHNDQKSHDRRTGGKVFRQKVGLTKLIDKARRRITHTCDTCGKTFKHESSLKYHIDFVHQNIKHHKCDRCPKEFSSKGGLNFHMSMVHDGITYTCDLCKRIFSHKGNLRVHINTLHMNNRKLFKCDECQKSFSYKCHLTVHIDNVHKGITHPCNLCEKVFTLKKNLKLHKDSVHTGITHRCNLCEKVFRHKKNLKLHKDSASAAREMREWNS